MIEMAMSRARVMTSALRGIADGIVIAGALAAMVIAMVAAMALFVMVGKLSQRREVAGAPSTRPSVPMSLPAGAEGVKRT